MLVRMVAKNICIANSRTQVSLEYIYFNLIISDSLSKIDLKYKKIVTTH